MHVDALLRDDPAPEQVADVRGERVDGPLLAVERERVVAAARVDPEGLVEPLHERVGLGVETLGERPVAPRQARQLGHPPLRVVDVALDLARRDRALRDAPVGEALRVARVLPRLVEEPARRPPLVLDEPVAVAVAPLVDPRERAQRRLVQLAREAEVLRPADHLREQDEPQRCRVDRAVVDGEPALRRLAVPNLVADLPRLGVDLRVVDLRLQAAPARAARRSRARARRAASGTR